MCLHPIHKELRVAKTNMRVFKVLRADLKSPFQDTQYHLRETVVVKTKLGGNTKRVIYKGLHSCRTFKKAESMKSGDSYRRVFRAIIPAGAIYKLGSYGDIASNMLRVTSQIK